MTDYDIFPTYTHERLKRIPDRERKALIKQYKHLGASAPGIISSVYLKSMYGKKTITDLKAEARKHGIYTTWADGADKSKTDLIQSLVLYLDNPKEYIKKQRALVGSYEPKKAERLKVADMSDDQRALNRLKLSELKDLCSKYDVKCSGKKIEIIDELLDTLTKSQLARVVTSPKAKRAPKVSPKASPKREKSPSSKRPARESPRQSSPDKRRIKVNDCLKKIGKPELVRFAEMYGMGTKSTLSKKLKPDLISLIAYHRSIR